MEKDPRFWHNCIYDAEVYCSICLGFDNEDCWNCCGTDRDSIPLSEILYDED